MDQYWNDLQEPKWEVTVPNVGHNLGDQKEALETLGAFVQSTIGGFTMPQETWSIDLPPASSTCTISLKTEHLKPTSIVAWLATSDDLDFRKSVYAEVKEGLAVDGDTVKGSIAIPKDKNVALFIEATYTASGKTFRLCSPTKLILKR
jgi:hypothetical protein